MTSPVLEQSTPESYFADIENRFAQCSENGALERDYRIAGFQVRLRFANRQLLNKLTPAFEHRLAKGMTHPDLTLGIWDRFSCGLDIPEPMWCRPEPILPGSIDYYRDGTLNMAFRHKNALSVLDRARGVGYQWFSNVHELTAVQAANPLRYFFHWWLLPHGFTLCHSAAAGTKNGAVLICGKAGSGKSTTTMACLSTGLSYVSDDLALVGGLDSSPSVTGIYASAKLNEDSLRRFPQWRERIENPDRTDREKAVFFLNKWIPGQLADCLKLRAILVPGVTGLAASRLRPIPPAAGLKALAPSSILQLCGEESHMLKNMTQLVSMCPSYSLELGTDLEQLAGLIRDISNGP
jgi:hypothetical protein